jgi:deoxyribodipyrimidine photo-lyase
VPNSLKRSLCWIRRDLRLYDHAALTAATQASEEVTIVFVFDTEILEKLDNPLDRRLTFIHDSLAELDSELRKLGSSLAVLHGNPVDLIPQFARDHAAQAVFTARDYEPYAIKRDVEVENRLNESGIQFHTVKDIVVLEPHEVRNQASAPFRVYTPFSKTWKQSANFPEFMADLSRLAKPKRECSLADYPLERLGFQRTDLWLSPGEAKGRELLHRFSSKLADYSTDRDFPAKEATSGLSVHLRFGTVSIRECFRVAEAQETTGEKWRSELVWREFYQHILGNFPNVVDHPFQPQYKDIHYPGDPSYFEAWCEGKTGFPIVDAAMRCFNATGWMHNRLRMVVASFLTKDLLLDYRWGEAYFAKHLLDFDLASNNGGWQWAASTGCDAQPYFRIFNPVLQSRKFDPDGTFIRQWVPELAGLSNVDIHWPADLKPIDLLSAGIALGTDYPSPIVEHHVQKEKAIAMMTVPTGTN